jgi:hypothetical protein
LNQERSHLFNILGAFGGERTRRVYLLGSGLSMLNQVKSHLFPLRCGYKYHAQELGKLFYYQTLIQDAFLIGRLYRAEIGRSISIPHPETRDFPSPVGEFCLRMLSNVRFRFLPIIQTLTDFLQGQHIGTRSWRVLIF